MAASDLPKLEVFTPLKARTALKNQHDRQRRIKPGHVARYAELITTAAWYPKTASPAICDTNGQWTNGIHRLTAISTLPEGTRVPIMVLRNAEPESLPHIDNGLSRTLGDQLGVAVPGLKHKNSVASIIGPCMTYTPTAKPRFTGKPAIEDAIEFALKYEDKLLEVAKVACNVSNADGPNGRAGHRIATPKTLGWLLFVTWDNPLAVPFWIGYANQKYIPSEDPRGKMTTYFRNNPDAIKRGAESNSQSLVRAAAMAAAWNAHVAKKKTWVAWDGSTETFPHPVS